MPELHNIQGYLSLANRTFAEAVALFRSRVEKLELLTHELDKARWAPADDGVSYSYHQWQTAQLSGGALDVTPYLLGWTPRVIPQLKSDWLEVGFWLRSDDVSASFSTDWRYLPDRVHSLFELCTAMLPIAIDAPVFLTDERQDGKPWESFVGSNEDLWAFDLAITSDSLDWPEVALPPGFVGTTLRAGRAIARAAIWPHLPWAPPVLREL